MKTGDTIRLIEGVTVYDALGADYLPTGTSGIVLNYFGDSVEMKTAKGVIYTIPAVSTVVELMENAA